MVGQIFQAISKGVEYLTLLRKTSHVRKLRKAVDYGETFINLFYELVDEEDVKKKKHIRTQMNYCKVKFYKLNQG